MRFGKPFTTNTVRRLLCLCFSIAGLILIPGCGRSASQEELGEIHYHLPPIDGMETRYYLPPLMQAKPKQQSTEGTSKANSEELSATEALANPDILEVDTTTPPSTPASDSASPEPAEGEAGAPSEPAPEKNTAPEVP